LSAYPTLGFGAAKGTYPPTLLQTPSMLRCAPMS
jgi:hypothetical protein